MSLPVVGVPCCVKTIGAHPFHAVGEKYIDAVAGGAGALPFLIPALGEWYDVPDLLSRIDGLLVTGSASMIGSKHYGGPDMPDGTLFDHSRDATTLPLIPAAIAAGVPVLGICRGLQETNVALGGTLHQKVHEIAGRLDHREDKAASVEVQYGPAHKVRLTPGGFFEKLAGASELTVNSIHEQGVDRLAPRLVVEAEAPDGQIEAVRVADAPSFAVAVQWHPEWKFRENPFSVALFRAFGDAVRARAERRRAANRAA